MNFVSSEKKQEIVCRIVSGKSQGTGTIVPINDDLCYVFTCHHVVENKNSTIIQQKMKGIICDFPIDEEEIFSSEADDIAVIQIKKAKHPSFQTVGLFMAIKSYDLPSALLSGFPSVNNYPLTTEDNFQCVLFDKGRVSGTTFRTEITLTTHDKYAEDVVKGCSGGAVYVEQDNCLYLSGIVGKYSEEAHYFTFTQIEKFHSLLLENKLSPIMVFSKDFIHCRKKLEQSKVQVAKLRSCIGRDLELSRGALVETAMASEEKCIILHGEPGVGKSVLLKKLAVKDEEAYFYFSSSDFGDKIEENIPLIKAWAEKDEEFLILIDGVEKIFENDAEEYLADFLKILESFQKIKVIMTIRDYSLNYLTRILSAGGLFQDKLVKLNVELLSDVEFDEISEKKPELKHLSPTVKELLRNPFYLDAVIIHELNKELDSIRNEYQLKDLLWKTITDDSKAVRLALLELVQEKLNSRNEFVEIEMSGDVVKTLSEKHVIIENNDCYKFSHDKYEDIASKKFFDKKITKKGQIIAVVKEIPTPLSWVRAYKLWICDRLTNGEIEKIVEDDHQLWTSDVSYVWKWNTIEAIYESKYLYTFLEVYAKSQNNSDTVFKRLHEIVSCSSLISVGEPKQGESEYEFFQQKVFPSHHCFQVLFFFYNNLALITESNITHVVQTLKESCKTGELYFLDLLNRKYTWLAEFVIQLINKYKEFDSFRLKSQLVGLCQGFSTFAPLSEEKSQEFLKTLCKSDDDKFSRNFSEILLFQSSDRGFFKHNQRFLMMFYVEILNLFTLYSKHKKNNHVWGNSYSCEELYDVPSRFHMGDSYPQHTILFYLLEVNFGKGLDYIISYLNDMMLVRFENNHHSDYVKMEEIPFTFQGKQRGILALEENYSSCLRNSNTPSLINSITKAVLLQIHQLSQKEDVSKYLCEILQKSNNLAMNSVGVNLIMLEIEKYFILFADVAENYDLRRLDIRNNGSSFEQGITFPSRDYLASYCNEGYFKIIEKDYSYDSSFFFTQIQPETKEKMLKIITHFQESNSLEVRNFAHNKDVRNLVAIQETEAGVVLQAKDTDDSDLQEYRKNIDDECKKNHEVTVLNLVLRYGQQEKYGQNLSMLLEDFNNGKYVDSLLAENLSPFELIYHLKSANDFSEENYNHMFLSLLQILENSNEVIRDYSLFPQVLEVLDYIQEIYLKKYKQRIVIALFMILLKVDISADDIVTQKMCKIPPILRNDLTNLLINYLYFDTSSLKTHKKMYEEEHAILRGEEQDNENNQIKHIIDSYQANQAPQLTDAFNPSHFKVCKAIVSMSSFENSRKIEQTFRDILVMMSQNQKAEWYKMSSIDLFFSASLFITISIKENWNLHELEDYIIANYQHFHTILKDNSNYISILVQNGTISSEGGWQSNEKIYCVLQKYDYFSECYTSVKDHFVPNRDYLDIGNLIKETFLIDYRWDLKNRPSKLIVLSGHEDEYIEFLMHFLQSPVGVYCFGYMLNNYPKQFPFHFLFQNSEKLLVSFSNPKLLTEDNVIFHYEKVFERVFQNYESIDDQEKNTFYELLASFGCNAPSSFSLYLKRKLEY